MRNIAVAIVVLLSLASCGGGGSDAPLVAAVPATPTNPVVVPPGPVVNPPPPVAPPSVQSGTQIEFVIQGTPFPLQATQTTNIEVRAPNYPGACIVRIAGICTKPTSVSISREFGVLNEFNDRGNSLNQNDARPQPASGPPYVAVLYQSNIFTGSNNVVKATVTAKGANGETVQREGFVLVDFAKPFEAGFLGGTQSVQVVPSIGFATPAATEPRVGSPVVVQGVLAGDAAGAKYTYSFVSVPPGSTAMIGLDPASNAGLFTPDKIGDYVVAFTPVYTDRRTAYPSYGLTIVQQASTAVSMFVRADPNRLGLDTFPFPQAAPDTSRIFVSASRNGLSTNIASVQGMLDGVALGSLTQTNITAQTCYKGRCETSTFFGFDIPKSRLGTAEHTFIANVTTNAGVTYSVGLTFLGEGGVESSGQLFKE